jgi:hypothetical protein
MDTAERALKDVEESAKTIKAARAKMEKTRKALRSMDAAGLLTPSQKTRMEKAIGKAPGRTGQRRRKGAPRTEEEKAAQRSTGPRAPKPAPEPGQAAVLGMQQ